MRGGFTAKGEYYLETKSSVGSLEAYQMFVALAAGSDMLLFSTDFSPAYLNSDLDHRHLYCGLPTLLLEMRGGEFGMGGRTKAAHVHKAWYGPPQKSQVLAIAPDGVPTGPGKDRC